MKIDTVVSVEDVHRTYAIGRIQVSALRGVTLRIQTGEFVAIMGPSGSGKSTLMNIMSGLDRPTQGTCRLAGHDLAQLSDDGLASLRNRFIGFVFQSFHLLPRLTALENVELPLIYRGLGGRERREKSHAALEAVGLSERLHHRPAEMSGGEQQRVAIARALVSEPSIIFADEPTGNLDSRTGQEILEIFRRLNEEQGMTIVQVTHDEDIARQCRRLIRLRDGKLEREEWLE